MEFRTRGTNLVFDDLATWIAGCRTLLSRRYMRDFMRAHWGALDQSFALVWIEQSDESTARNFLAVINDAPLNRRGEKWNRLTLAARTRIALLTKPAAA